MNTNLTGGRLAAIIAGGAIASLATLVLLAGAGFQWLDNQKDADGYYTTSSQRFETGTYALTSENLDVDDGPLHLNTRLRVSSQDGAPVFVGIARTTDVQDYLSGTAHTTVTDFEVDPFDVDYTTVPGTTKPAAPDTQTFWAAKTQGAGEQTLKWDVHEGDWSVVVMNADGSAGVHTAVSAGADLPFVGGAATGLIAGGLGGLTLGALLLAFGMIRPRRDRLALA